MNTINKQAEAAFIQQVRALYSMLTVDERVEVLAQIKAAVKGGVVA